VTVIAWDGKVLAGDRQSTHDGTPTPRRKVYRIKRPDGGLVLFGCAGSTADAHLYMRWASGEVKETPTFDDLVVLSIDEQRRVWCATQKMHWYPVHMPFWAIGSGADYALGAMAAGKSSREAVKIASELDINCGQGVNVVRFK
jgi:ATP-dependent protease HslVU (ClpYQ) peptidase subunit